MATDSDQRHVFDFLRERLESQEPFTRADLADVTSWKKTTPGTYWSKQFKPFVDEVSKGTFRVTEAFRPYSKWEQFKQHVTQVRRVTATDYDKSEYDKVLIYEFFMPLTNELALRGTLDALFYKDTILARLRVLDSAGVEAQFLRTPGERDEEYLDRLCEWLSKRFVGYSIGQVGGRFRIGPLLTREQAAELEKEERYLIDETTSVTRFIFPCIEEEVDAIRWFFEALFIDSIIEVVNGEDEIWMVESGLRNRLHIWKVEKVD